MLSVDNDRIPPALKRFGRLIFRASNIPALVAGIIVTLLGIHAEQQARLLFSERQHAETVQLLNGIRERIEDEILGDMNVTEGLAAAIAVDPDMTQERFAAFADKLLDARPNIRSFAAAPISW